MTTFPGFETSYPFTGSPSMADIAKHACAECGAWVREDQRSEGEEVRHTRKCKSRPLIQAGPAFAATGRFVKVADRWYLRIEGTVVKGSTIQVRKSDGSVVYKTVGEETSERSGIYEVV